MAITDLGNTGSSSNPVTFTVSAAVASGNLIVVMLIIDNGVAMATGQVTDSKSNTYTLATTCNTGGNDQGIFYSFITTPLTTSDTISYTHGVAGFSSINASSITGYTAIDPATTVSQAGNATAATITGAGSAAVANEIYVGFESGAQGGTLGAPDPPTGWSKSGFSAVFASNAGIWQVNSGTSALSFTTTYTGAVNIYQNLVSFMPPTPPPAVTRMGAISL